MCLRARREHQRDRVTPQQPCGSSGLGGDVRRLSGRCCAHCGAAGKGSGLAGEEVVRGDLMVAVTIQEERSLEMPRKHHNKRASGSAAADGRREACDPNTPGP